MKLETNLKELFSKYLAGQASVSELSQLLNYFQEENDSARLYSLILAELEKEDRLPITAGQQAILGRVSVALYDRVLQSKRKVRKLYWSIGAAAAVLVFVGSWAGVRFGIFDSISSTSEHLAILPGDDRAILKLEDGTIIDLDSEIRDDSEEGYLSKDSGGMMTFNTTNLPAEADNVGQRTLSTPKGGQIAAILADGTKVWLNAESSITFPTRFDQTNRIVDITGEVYFEVAQKKDQPFLVHTRQQTIRVLGTHFNINAYRERNRVRTSLLEGRVAVSAGGNQIELKPGQMCLWNENKGGLAVENIADLDNLLAWKSGMFSFDKSNIVDIMHTLSRWYDIEVIFEKGSYSDCIFDGMISKKESFEQVLRVLATSQQLAFEVKGRKVTVSLVNN